MTTTEIKKTHREAGDSSDWSPSPTSGVQTSCCHGDVREQQERLTAGRLLALHRVQLPRDINFCLHITSEPEKTTPRNLTAFAISMFDWPPEKCWTSSKVNLFCSGSGLSQPSGVTNDKPPGFKRKKKKRSIGSVCWFPVFSCKWKIVSLLKISAQRDEGWNVWSAKCTEIYNESSASLE